MQWERAGVRVRCALAHNNMAMAMLRATRRTIGDEWNTVSFCYFNLPLHFVRILLTI